jgi:hypothetical protein
MVIISKEIIIYLVKEESINHFFIGFKTTDPK